MKPTDITRHTFEEKVRDATALAGIHDLSTNEVAQLKSRIQFALFDSNPADLSVAQIADWIRRVVPGMRRSTSVIAQHTKIADGVVDTDGRKVTAAAAPEIETLAAGEVLCTLVGDRRVRFNPNNLVVTPLRTEGDE